MQLEAGCLGHVHGQGARAVARRRPARADDRAPAGKGKRAETVDLSAVVGSGSPGGIRTLMSKIHGLLAPDLSVSIGTLRTLSVKGVYVSCRRLRRGKLKLSLARRFVSTGHQNEPAEERRSRTPLEKQKWTSAPMTSCT